MKWNLNNTRAVFLLAIVMIIGVGMNSYFLYTDAEKYLENDAGHEAKILSTALASFRALYTSEVASRVDAHGIEVTHDYKNKEGAIPLPATMTELIAKNFSMSGEGKTVRLYSDYPFPWKKDGGVRDTFQKDALKALRENPTVAFHRIEMIDGVDTYRYATADVMQESCVNCHNTHPQTPKNDWKEGDVRGALEVTFPMQSITTSSDNSTLMHIVMTFLLALFSIIIMFGSIFVLNREKKRLQQKVEDSTSELRNREQNLIDEKSRLSAVIDNVVDGIITIDEKGYIEKFNAAAEKIFGYSEEEVIGQNVKMLMPDPYHSEHDGYLDHHNKTGEKKIIGIGREVIGKRKDGSTFPLELGVSAVSINDEKHFVGIIREISEQREAEKKALGLKEELQGVFNSVIDGMVIIDEKGKVSAFNPAAEKIFGYSQEEVMGKNVKMLMPEPYHSEHDGYLSNYMSGGKAKVIGIGREVEGRRKDGSTFPLHLGVTKSKNYGLPQYVGMVRDLTEQKRLEKLKSEFVSTVSHELRTPLTSIRGSLSLVDSGVMGEVSDKVGPLVQIALNNSERLILLINDILDMEKIESGMMDFELVQADLDSIIEEAIIFNEGYAKAHEVSLSFDKFNRKVPVYVDVNRMQQILSNLISNAVKYSPKNDTVTLSLTIKKRLVHVEVHDNGPGIPEEFKRRIFQKFAQADASDTKQKGGTGLGLNITKAIVEKFGGTIGFYSPVGQGTTFFFDLPLISEVTSSSELIEQARGRILIVEDDHDIATLIRIMLEHEGLECDIAYNAKEAKLLLQKDKYDAMTLDIMLPDQDGISLLEEIREDEIYHDLAVIVVSAKALSSKAENAKVALEVVDWVNKPIDQKQLMMSLNKVIASNEGAQPRILHVEDDPDIAHVVKLLISDLGEIDLATSKAEAMTKLEKHEQYDLILLDMQLPDGSAEELMPYIKEHYSTTPIILFSAQEVDNKLKEQVSKALVKSRTSNTLLVETIKNIIQQ